jgi:hypothetical protein
LNASLASLMTAWKKVSTVDLGELNAALTRAGFPPLASGSKGDISSKQLDLEADVPLRLVRIQ